MFQLRRLSYNWWKVLALWAVSTEQVIIFIIVKPFWHIRICFDGFIIIVEFLTETAIRICIIQRIFFLPLKILQVFILKWQDLFSMQMFHKVLVNSSNLLFCLYIGPNVFWTHRRTGYLDWNRYSQDFLLNKLSNPPRL